MFECLRKIGDCKIGTRKPENEGRKMEKGESMTKSGVGILKSLSVCRKNKSKKVLMIISGFWKVIESDDSVWLEYFRLNQIHVPLHV